MQETQVWSLGQEDPLEKERATHSSILAWRIPGTKEPGGQQSAGSRRIRHNLAFRGDVSGATWMGLEFTSICYKWIRPNSSFYWKKPCGKQHKDRDINRPCSLLFFSLKKRGKREIERMRQQSENSSTEQMGHLWWNGSSVDAAHLWVS